jgi:hypothetical protein
LATLEVCDATVTISADPLRGGPVDQNGNAMVNNLPLVVALGSCDVGCPGDLDGDNQRTLNDLGLLSDALFAAGAPFIVPIPPGDPLGDLDGDNQLTLNDLGMLSDMLFGAGAPFIVPCP